MENNSINENCIFCKLANKEIPTKITFEDENFIAFPDAHPKADGHTLIIPKRHYHNLMDMPATMGNELLDAVKKVSLNLIKEKNAQGINILSNNEKAAGQVVLHAHVHIIPRKINDNVKIFE